MIERDSQPISIRVVKEIAKREGIDPTQLSEPLARTINPEALDALFTGGSGTIEFEYVGYRVTIEQDEAIVVEPLAKTTS